MNKAVSGTGAGKRRFLFLQGCTSPFFAHLGDALRQRGHQVYRVNFNLGDALYWRGREAWAFRDSVDQLPAFLEEKFARYQFTDLIVLGDTRPVHAAALPIARRKGARIHVLEEGYFRPGWLTLEEGGINGYSPLPKEPEWYLEANKLIPKLCVPESVPNPVRLLALHEIAYHLPNLFNVWRYPGYRTHRPNVSGVEFWGWGNRFARMPLYERRDSRRIERLVTSKQPFYLFPLQLNSDSQIKNHSRPGSVPKLVRDVIRSFYHHAPANAQLVIKNHPLDTGLIKYRKWIERLQRRLKKLDRIIYLESGHLPTLLDHAKGTVLVNSSVGTSAFVHRCPTIALGDAIYNMEGLTFQGGLDAFWCNANPPDDNLFRAFRNVVVYATQVNGGFYTRKGIALGVRECADRLEQPCSRLQALMLKTEGVPGFCFTD